MQEIIQTLARRYPQLCLPIRAGMRQSEEYRNAVLCGCPVETEPEFLCPEAIELSSADTPAGTAEILSLGERADFLHAYRALAYRCEPKEIPDSVGAAAIRGLINWEKIRAHQEEYLRAGGGDWDAEFQRFTADRKNYTDSLILLSGGDYSNLPASAVGLDAEAWRQKSRLIRKYHELTHFVCRGLWPDDVDALRDEVIADSIGVVAAFGKNDPALIRRFLGLEGGAFRAGGRLSHYVGEDELPAAVVRADAMIDEYAARIARAQTDGKDPLSLLLKIFP